jgi:uncharacterized membrane protein
MNRVVLKDIPLKPAGFSHWPKRIHYLLFALFLVVFLLVWGRLWLPLPFLGPGHWPDGLLVVLAAATTLASLTCRLPGQNVMLASMIIAVIGGAAHTIGALTAIPFGPIVYTDRVGQRLFDPLPWAVPLLWLVAILNSRGVARLILRPWRQTRVYGFWLLGLAVALVVLLDLALEPYATQVKEFWRWQPTKLPLDWYTAPLVNFFAWAVVALLILAFATPSLLNKKPVKSPPDYHSLAVWLLLNLLFLTGAAVHHFRIASAVILAQSLVVAACALRGARW